MKPALFTLCAFALLSAWLQSWRPIIFLGIVAAGLLQGVLLVAMGTLLIGSDEVADEPEPEGGILLAFSDPLD